MVSVSLTPGRFDGGVVFLRVRLAHDTLVPDSHGGSNCGPLFGLSGWIERLGLTVGSVRS